MERAYRQRMAKSQERKDFFTGMWLIEGRPVPSFVPDHAKTAVASATVRNLKAGGLARRQAMTADEASLLRDAAKNLKLRPEGRPSGPSYEQSRHDFEMKIKDATQRLVREGRRITLANVAEYLSRHERTLRRDWERWGYTSWKQLRDRV